MLGQQRRLQQSQELNGIYTKNHFEASVNNHNLSQSQMQQKFLSDNLNMPSTTNMPFSSSLTGLIDRFFNPCTSLIITPIGNITKLEIWGKAQRESARRPKSDWGILGGRSKKAGGENFPGIKVTWPEVKCIGIRRTRFVDLG